MRHALPMNSSGRFLSEPQADGSLHYCDCLTQARFIATTLVNTPSNLHLAWQLNYFRHPFMLPVVRFFIQDDELVLLSPIPEAHSPITEHKVTRMRGGALNFLPAQVITLAEQLRNFGMVPGFRLERLFWDDQELKMQVPLGMMDRAYLPQGERNQAHTEATLVYATGAFLLHILLGRYSKSEAFENPCESLRRLRGGWAQALEEMVHPDVSQRPSFETLRGTSQRILKQPFEKEVCHKIFHGFNETMSHSITEVSNSKRKVLFLEKLPGRERFSRLLPWIAREEKKGAWVPHLWFPQTTPRRYTVLNQLLLLIKNQLTTYGFGKLAQSCEPLKDWAELHQAEADCNKLFQRLCESLVGKHAKRVWLVLEDVAHADQASVEILLKLAQDEDNDWFRLLLCDLHSMQANLRVHLPNDAIEPLPLLDPEQLGQSLKRPLKTAPSVIDPRLFPPLLEAASVTQVQGFEQIWPCFSPLEQLLLKVSAIAPEPVAIAAVSDAFTIEHLEPVCERLLHLHWLSGDPVGFAPTGFLLRTELLARMAGDERKSLAHTLYEALPQTAETLLLRAYLAHALGQLEDCALLLNQMEDLISEEGRFDLLNRMLHWPQGFVAEPFMDFLLLAQVRAGFTTDAPAKRFVKIHEALLRGHLRRTQGAYKDAIAAYRTLAAKRQLLPVWRAEILVEMALCARINGIGLEVPEATRRFFRISTYSETLLQDTYKEWVAILAAANPKEHMRGKLREAAESLPKPMQAWIRAQHCLTAGEFTDAAQQLRLAKSWLDHHPRLRLRAFYKKCRGVAAYRQNQAENARLHFQDLERIHEQLDDQVGIENARFNLASAEMLAGALRSAHKRFEHMLAHVKDDPLLECQLHYYLATCAQLRGQETVFQSHQQQHSRLAVVLRAYDEQCKNLILQLWQPSLLSSGTLERLATKLIRLLRKPNLPELLHHEAGLALIFSHWVTGQPLDLEAIPENQLTRWRLNFMKLMRGESDQELKPMLEELESDYFAALHTLLLAEMIVMKRLSNKQLAQIPEHFFRQKALAFGADYPAEVYSETAMGSSDQPETQWFACMKAVQQIPDSGVFSLQDRNRLLTIFAQLWAYQSHGVAQRINGKWSLGKDRQHDNALQQALAQFKQVPKHPFTASCILENTSYSLLCLPLHLPSAKAVLWFLSSEQQDMPSGRVLTTFAKLFQIAFYRLEFEKPAQPIADLPSFGMIGHSTNMQKVRKTIAEFGASDLNIYIWGASGTGKELTAKAFHDASGRAHQPFRAINCSHFNESLVASELFGHVRGAFTGAAASKAGLLELVDGGTLFLDEIGDLSPKIQSLLLRVIQEGEFTRVGDSQTRYVDIRFISATNKSLHELIDQGTFREDLYFRLVGEEIHLPSLQQRFEDLPDLVLHFAKKASGGKRTCHFSKDFYQHLRSYHWPGNIRELESYVAKMLVKEPDVEVFEAKHCPEFLRANNYQNEAELLESEGSLDEWLAFQQKAFVQQRYLTYGHNRLRTAESLNISRERLRRILEQDKFEQNSVD